MFKKFVSRSVFGEHQPAQISLNFKNSYCKLNIRDLGAKLCFASLLFCFWKDYVVLKSQSSCILLNKNVNFNKNETGLKIWKTPHTVLERRTMCLSSFKNRKLKVKLLWVGARERRKKAFFVPLILSEGNFLTFVFYFNVWCIKYIFRIYILLHNKKDYFKHFGACF